MLQNENAENSYQLYLAGGGEMAHLTRSFDWSKTSLGTPNKWSRNLLTTLSIIFHSKFPMFLWWGDDLIQFYNDAYRPSLGNDGKHPMALGQRGKDCWPENWPEIKPLIDQVMNGGEATWSEDQLIRAFRNNKLEEVYWTFCYSRVIDVGGCIGGVLVTCTETTQKVKEKQLLDKDLKNIAEREARLNHLISQAPVGIGLLKDRNLIIEAANDKILQFWGKTVSVIGKPLASALPELEGQPFLNILDNVYTSGIPYTSNEIQATLEHGGALKTFYFELLYQPIISSTEEINSILVLATDITAQVEARKVIEECSSEFRQMAEYIIQMVWVTDALGMHEYYNKRWYDFTGSDFETTKNEGWSNMFHPEDREMAWDKWRHSLETGEPYEVEYRLKNYADEYIWVLGRAAPFYNADGKIVKWFGTCTDINEQKLLQQQKDDFISIASHELKTPVTTLKASVQLIKRLIDNPSPKVENLINRSNKIIDKVGRLIDDLLNVSKFNQGQLHLNKTQFKLIEIVEECTELISLEGKYEINIFADQLLEVHADRERIGQVITNFLSNALKYAPTSSQVNIKIAVQDQSAIVSVSDHGLGIAPDKIPHLFDRYYRADSEGTQYSGLGLGLYICAEIIKKHNGKIGVNSKIDAGSEFWFTLPLTDDD